MYQHEIAIRVRYAETDQMGYVYYGNYAMYYEVARVEAFRALGFPYKELEAMGIGMPVLSLNINYKRPGKYDDLLTIKVTIPEAPRARIKFHYEVTNQDGSLINTGETELVFMRMDSGRATRIPTELAELLEPYFK
ncbi:acyl-CoA thioesterase [Marinoscillum furvescens]|uniref:Acyl-CoA thioester hydrolase n=1 Tax=Marinoscillum furvescens DSM 4134 TaxID=1122208 RepID=A0A3D9L5C7_MARFU|nr:thioesterase family protein [Marinoscillum furvescens]RED99829.1 acyl-CoA thioester hydrolase [Marinoscillum furvescens DSM 4134]